MNSSTNLGKILITGGAGYIGSQAAIALLAAKFEILILDNFVYGHQDLIAKVTPHLIIGDLSCRLLLDRIFAEHQIAAVIHFAAYAYVGESVKDPGKYYRNNVFGSLNLLEAMVKAGVKKLVFSSTCATYGLPQQIPITESHPQAPINPYLKAHSSCLGSGKLLTSAARAIALSADKIASNKIKTKIVGNVSTRSESG